MTEALEAGMTVMPQIRAIDWEELRNKVRKSRPVPNFCVDNFLEQGFADEVAACFPSFDFARQHGTTFTSDYEKGKYQLTDPALYPPPLRTLHETLSSQPFLDIMSMVMDIPKLVDDPTLAGAGLHQTRKRGKLGVHIDFNYHKKLDLHRRLNILLYLNPRWKEDWGGQIELWNKDVSVCEHSFVPKFNRCVVFETNEVSFHGVADIKCPDEEVRRSYAAYYYTKEPPAHWDGESHGTIFKPRPTDHYDRFVRPVLKPLTDRIAWKYDSIAEKLKGKKSQDGS